MGKYHLINSCNKCGELQNEITPKSTIESHVCEAETLCKNCWFKDYWAYGYFESSCDQDGIESNCKTYGE